jgi:hypothetical protein
VTHAADFSVSGNDATLASWVADHPGALIAFHADDDSDVARVVGLGSEPGPSAVALDALQLADGVIAVNMVVVGTPPDRLGRFTRPLAVRVDVDGAVVNTTKATSIVVATGQYLRGLDVVPRGHPGDGRLETQVYRLRPGERHGMRSRLPSGTHIPHPRIAQRPGHRVEVLSTHPFAVEIDGQPAPERRALEVEIVPNAYRLLV